MLTLTVLASALPLLLTAQGAALQKKDLVDPGPLPYTQPLTGASLPDEPGFPDFQGPAIYDGKFQKAIYLSIDGFHAVRLSFQFLRRQRLELTETEILGISYRPILSTMSRPSLHLPWPLFSKLPSNIPMLDVALLPTPCPERWL